MRELRSIVWAGGSTYDVTLADGDRVVRGRCEIVDHDGIRLLHTSPIGFLEGTARQAVDRAIWAFHVATHPVPIDAVLDEALSLIANARRGDSLAFELASRRDSIGASRRIRIALIERAAQMVDVEDAERLLRLADQWPDVGTEDRDRCEQLLDEIEARLGPNPRVAVLRARTDT